MTSSAYGLSLTHEELGRRLNTADWVFVVLMLSFRPERHRMMTWKGRAEAARCQLCRGQGRLQARHHNHLCPRDRVHNPRPRMGRCKRV